MLFLILITICVLLTVFILRINRDYWKKRNVVEVKGALFDFIFGKVSLAEIYKDIYDKNPKELHVGIYLGLKPALLLRDLENIQAVLASDFKSFYSRGITLNPNDTLGDNVLFIDDYSRWKLLRQKLSPVFTSLKLRNMFQIIEKCARDFVETVEETSDVADKPFEVIYTYTAASITASIFGIDTDTKNAINSPFLRMSKAVTTPSLKQKIVFFIGNTFPKLFNVIDVQSFGEFKEFFVGAVSKVLRSRSADNVKRYDFIDICLELQKQGIMKDPVTGYELEPTDEVLAAQAFFFFVAGADTTANTMHFTLIELSYNSDILKRVHEEIDQVFRTSGEKLTYNDIEKLTYLEMVINEAMRKYPPIGFVQRRCTKDTVLPKGQIRIAKDALVIIPIYGIHRDEKYYPNPELFDPERFSQDNSDSVPKYAFLPFGEGNRICIGMRLAILQLIAGLAWLLRRYTLREKPSSPLRFERSSFALSAPDARYVFVPRDLL